jgi:hypothetical protein
VGICGGTERVRYITDEKNVLQRAKYDIPYSQPNVDNGEKVRIN